MSRNLAAIGAVVLMGGAVGCSLPMGSFARPVHAAPEGASRIGGGLMVPFSVAGAVTESTTDSSGASFNVFDEGVFYAPGFSYDYAFEDGYTWGVDVAFLNQDLVSGAEKADFTFIKVNPRVEFPMGGADRTLSWTIDGNLMYWTGRGSNGEIFNIPLFTPTIGLRYYLNTGFGGLVLAQNIGTAFVTVTVPGSVSYDIPLGPIHVMPEFRWDPTFFFVGVEGTVAGVLAAFSAGATIMVEI